MRLIKQQTELLFNLKTAVNKYNKNEIIYKSEYLGYLPYGYYHWIEVKGNEVKTSNPDAIQHDLEALKKSNYISRTKEIKHDEDNIHIYFEIINK